jgi:DNA end-binding protein Ku
MSTATQSPRRKHINKAHTRKSTDPDAHGGGGGGKRKGGGAYRATKREAGEDYGALGRPVWSGSISFGLVNIPVRLHVAVREQRIAFHMLHDQDKVRLRRRMVCPEDGKEVHPEHIVRGYEVEKDKYIVIQDEELESCAPEKTKTIEITDFVKLGEIDPIYYDRPYYVIPQAGASKSYRLLAEAMKRTKRVGLARVVMHEKEHLVALRPLNGLLCLETMNFADEMVPLDDVEDIPRAMKIADKELKAAQHAVRELSGNFNPREFKDEYRRCVREMLEKKAKGDNVVTVEPEQDEEDSKKPARSATNLMAALEESLANAKKQSGGGGRSKRRKSA